MSATVLGWTDWELQRDKDGHRDYDIEWLLRVDSPDDGPAIAMTAPGLPAIGSTWSFANDNDIWAYCWPNWTARPTLTGEPGYYWKVKQRFSTRPFKRCQDNSIENPLSEPPRVSGNFQRCTREATHDRHGNPLLSSSLEQLRGVQVDDNRQIVRIGLNVLVLPDYVFSFIDDVNDAPLWGLGARCWKLSDAPWTRHVYGTCSFYYTVDFDFEAKKDTWTRRILDEGTRVLLPGGNPANPKHFGQYKDNNGENTRVLLDGAGGPLEDIDDPHFVEAELYEESNFLMLGIPVLL